MFTKLHPENATRAVRQKKKGPVDPGVGLRIRTLRLERRLTQAQLAGRDFTKGFISLVETGRTRISMRAAEILARRLSVGVTELFTTPSGELQAEAYRIEYGWDRIAIVRPANVYGPYDNFELGNAMVVPSLIRRALLGENPLSVWGDGSALRDFVHARDVAAGMLVALERGLGQPLNLGSGTGVSIQELVEVITGELEVKPEVVWDASKPSGDRGMMTRTHGGDPDRR